MAPFDLDYSRLLLLTLAVLVALSLLGAGATSSASFGAFNPSWDGATALREEASTMDVRSEIIGDTSELGEFEADGTLVVILSPDRAYSADEVARLSDFLDAGGTVLVAEDYGGNTNPLLSRLGASARINGTPLRDGRNNFRSAAFPVANSVSNHSLVDNVSGLTLNHGTVVRPDGATVLINSSSFSYLDGNGNEELDADESIRPYPVATVEPVGGGRVIVVSDPSVFINAMIERRGNAAFLDRVISGHERVVIDASHTADIPVLVRLTMILQESAAVQFLVGLAGLALVVAASRWRIVAARIEDRFGSGSNEPVRLSAGEIESAIEARHPDWDPARVRRVTRRLTGDGAGETHREE